MHHDLKIDKPYLEAKLAGNKLFEIRCNDRGYQKGDTVSYYENKPLQRLRHTFEIIYVSNYCQRDNYVVFGEKHIESKED